MQLERPRESLDCAKNTNPPDPGFESEGLVGFVGAH